MSQRVGPRAHIDREHWTEVMVTGALASKFRGSGKPMQRRTNEGVGFRMKAPLSLSSDLLV